MNDNVKVGDDQLLADSATIEAGMMQSRTRESPEDLEYQSM